jgi:hypothetical protein
VRTPIKEKPMPDPPASDAMVSIQIRGSHPEVNANDLGRAVLIDPRSAMAPFGAVNRRLEAGTEVELLIGLGIAEGPVARVGIAAVDLYDVSGRDDTGFVVFRLGTPVGGFVSTRVPRDLRSVLTGRLSAEGNAAFWPVVEDRGLARPGGEGAVTDAMRLQIGSRYAELSRSALRRIHDDGEFWPPWCLFRCHPEDLHDRPR